MPIDRQKCQLAYRETRLGLSRAAALAAETMLSLAEARLRHARGAKHLSPRVDSNASTCRRYIAVRRVGPPCDVCLQLHGKLVHHASNPQCRAPTANPLFCNMTFFSVLLGRTKITCTKSLFGRFDLLRAMCSGYMCSGPHTQRWALARYVACACPIAGSAGQSMTSEH